MTTNINLKMAVLYERYNDFQAEKGLDLIDRLPLKAGNFILDVGCGTGELTYELAKKVGIYGKVFALDPDAARLKVAIENQPSELHNIVWHNSSIELFSDLSEDSIDAVYSNYVLHWIKEKKPALLKINKLLKPSGYFAANCIAGYSDIIVKIESSAGLEILIINNKKDWVNLLTECDFTIISSFVIDDCEFSSLDDFLLFWEATRQGIFKRKNLPKNAYDDLISLYPGKIKIFGNETLSILCSKKTFDHF